MGHPRQYEINSSYYRAFRMLVRHFFDQGDIVAQADIDATILADTKNKKLLTQAHFYLDFPSLDPNQIRARGTKRKPEPSRYGTNKRSKGPKGGKKDPAEAFGKMSLDLKENQTANQASAKDRKKARQQAMREKAAAEQAASTNYGSATAESMPIAVEIQDKQCSEKNWVARASPDEPLGQTVTMQPMSSNSHVLAGYELPSGDDRLDWDTDRVRRLFGEM
jgi:hypothetical protein